MKRTLAALLLAASSPALALCPYPLDATQAQMDAWPEKGLYQRAPIVNDRSMEFAIIDTAYQPYIALSDTGLQAIIDGFNSNTPQGDVQIPAPGQRTHIRMKIDNFVWDRFQASNGAIWLAVGITTGNAGTPQPKSSLTLTVSLINSNQLEANNGSRILLNVNGQSISPTTFSDIHRYDAMPETLAADIIGFWIDGTTREIGLSAHLVENNPLGLPAGDYDFETLTDKQGEPYKVPAGVDQVSIGLIGLVGTGPVFEPLVGQPVGGTLETDHCGSTGPEPVRLPNGQLFPGKGKALGLLKQQNLPLPPTPKAFK